MQQILAYETDLLDYGDIFDGSAEIAAKVEELKQAALEELDHIERLGGAIAAVEMGYMKKQLVESNTARLEAIERNEQTVVGVNRFVETEPSPLTTGDDTIMTVSHEVEAEQIARLNAWRAARDANAVAAALEELRRAARRRHQHHAGLDRLRQSRRHHRRMGLCAARGVRRISARRPASAGRAQRHRRASTTSAPRSTACRASSAGA